MESPVEAMLLAMISALAFLCPGCLRNRASKRTFARLAMPTALFESSWKRQSEY